MKLKDLMQKHIYTCNKLLQVKEIKGVFLSSEFQILSVTDLTSVSPYKDVTQSTYISIVNGKQLFSFLFWCGRNKEIRKEYLGTGTSKHHYFRLSNG